MDKSTALSTNSLCIPHIFTAEPSFISYPCRRAVVCLTAARACPIPGIPSSASWTSINGTELSGYISDMPSSPILPWSATCGVHTTSILLVVCNCMIDEAAKAVSIKSSRHIQFVRPCNRCTYQDIRALSSHQTNVLVTIASIELRICCPFTPAPLPSFALIPGI